eukprot:scaffold57770_cov63-Attheya_sp.AAC.2
MYSSFSKRRCYSAVPSNGAATEKGGHFVTRGNQFERYRGFPHTTTPSNGVTREDNLFQSDSDRRGDENLCMDHTSDRFRGFRDAAPSNGVARDDGLFLSSSGRSGGEVRIDLSDDRFRRGYSTAISHDGVARDVGSFVSDSNCGDKGRMDHNNDHFRGFPSVVSDGVARDVDSFLSDSTRCDDDFRMNHTNDRFHSGFPQAPNNGVMAREQDCSFASHSNLRSDEFLRMETENRMHGFYGALSNGVERENGVFASGSDRCSDRIIRMNTDNHLRRFYRACHNSVARGDGLLASGSGNRGDKVRIDLTNGDVDLDRPESTCSNGYMISHCGIHGAFYPWTSDQNFLNHNDCLDSNTSFTQTATSSNPNLSIDKTIPKEYPPAVVSSNNDDLLSSLLTHPKFNHLLDDSIENIAFIFEENKDLPSSKALCDMGSLSHERWSRTKPRLHCVMQNTLPSGMFYVARSANVCHYQCRMRTLIKSLQAYEGSTIEINIYNPLCDYTNGFMTVGNTMESTQALQQHLNWNVLETILDDSNSTDTSLDSTSSTSSSTPKRKRQAVENFVDFGWTSSTCQTRNGSSTGVAVPRLKPQTESPLISEVFLQASSIIKTISVQWLEKSECIFQDSDEPSRKSDFQDAIAHGNIVQAIRVAKNDATQLCSAHDDTENSKKPTMSNVISFSKLNRSARVALICYGRQSVDVVLKESGRLDPFTKSVIDFYAGVEDKKRVVTPELLQGVKSFPIPGFPVVSNDCNLDPFSFHLTFVELVLRLITKFDLNLLEIFSVVTCYEIFPHCLYYFGVAANTLLLDVETKHTKKFRGVLFGFRVAQLMMEIFKATRDVSSTSSTKLPPTRFHCYTSLVKITTLPTLSVWEE